MAQTLEEILHIEKQVNVDVVRFLCAQVFDPEDVELVEQELLATIAAGTPPHVVLDMENVTHISSIMLSLLVEAYTMATKAGGRIAMAAVTPRLRDLLEIVRIHDLFENYASTESAVAALLA